MHPLSRHSIDHRDMVALYLSDQLSDSDREAFESYYLEHPDILRELNRTAQFKSGLHDLRESGLLDSILTKRPWWVLSPLLAIAASVIIVVLIGYFWLSTQQTANSVLVASVAHLTNRFDSKIKIAESRSIQRTRTSSYDATISLPAERAAIELRIRPEVAANEGKYRVKFGALKGVGSSALASVEGVRAGDDGFVPVYLDSSKLSPGVYSISISADEIGNAVTSASQFLIELTAPEAHSR